MRSIVCALFLLASSTPTFVAQTDRRQSMWMTMGSCAGTLRSRKLHSLA